MLIYIQVILKVPSGKLLHGYWKMAIYSWFTHQKWWFSIVMLVYQRVYFGTLFPTSFWTCQKGPPEKDNIEINKINGARLPWLQNHPSVWQRPIDLPRVYVFTCKGSITGVIPESRNVSSEWIRTQPGVFFNVHDTTGYNRHIFAT